MASRQPSLLYFKTHINESGIHLMIMCSTPWRYKHVQPARGAVLIGNANSRTLKKSNGCGENVLIDGSRKE